MLSERSVLYDSSSSTRKNRFYFLQKKFTVHDGILQSTVRGGYDPGSLLRSPFRMGSQGSYQQQAYPLYYDPSRDRSLRRWYDIRLPEAGISTEVRNDESYSSMVIINIIIFCRRWWRFHSFWHHHPLSHPLNNYSICTVRLYNTVQS